MWDDAQLETQDPFPLKETNLNMLENSKVTSISSLFETEFQIQLTDLLAKYKNCFAWDYHEMPSLDQKPVEHRHPIKVGFKPHKQPPKRMTTEVTLKVKEVEHLLKARFIRTARYVN